MLVYTHNNDTFSALKLRDLWVRTGTESLLIAVRSEQEHYLRPCVIESSPRVRNYFETNLKVLPSQWAVRLEGHCLSKDDSKIN